MSERLSRSALPTIRACIATLAVALCALRPVRAQEIFGTLRHLDSGTPASGVVVTASLAANDSTVVRAITGARGTFVLRVPAAPVVVRVLRVGQQPFELARLTLMSGSRHELSALLPDVPVRLATFDARVDTRCRVDPVNRTLVVQLFDEARKALWANQLAEENTSATALIQRVVQQYDTRQRPVGAPIVRRGSETTLRPFSSANVDSLIKNGFREITADDAMIYYAPDAEVLTSDQFLSHYCLRLNTDSVTYPEWRGVAFEPARTQRGVVQVRGTLWLDRVTHELRRIDYGYSGLEPMLARATPGGIVEYTSLADGFWFVHEWSIRMPIVAQFTRRVVGGPELDFIELSGVQVTSGQVLELRAGNELIFSAGLVSNDPAVESLVAPLIALRDTTNCDTLPVQQAPQSSDTLSTISGVLRDANGKPLAGVLVRALWTETIRTGELIRRNEQYYDEDREFFTHTGPDGVFHLCDLPRRVRLAIEAGNPDATIARVTMRIDRNTNHARIALKARAHRVP